MYGIYNKTLSIVVLHDYLCHVIERIEPIVWKILYCQLDASKPELLPFLCALQNDMIGVHNKNS